MRRRLKAAAWVLVFSMLMTSASMQILAKEKFQEETVLPKKRQQIKEIGQLEMPELSEENKEIIEVSDLNSFTAAVQEATTGDELTSTNPWQNKRLVVKSPEGFDPKGAISIIQGYDQIFVLDYATEEETKAAYAYLQTIPYLTVEPDEMVSTSSVLKQSVEENRENAVSTEWDGIRNAEVIVAVIDTGYDTVGCGADRIISGIDLTGEGNIWDNNGHGTEMANIILDHGGNSVKVMPIKAADKEGRSSSLKMYLGIRHAIENGADIINISMSAYKTSDEGIIKSVIEEAVSKGIAVVVAAGNNGEDTANYVPANVDAAVVVSAVNTDRTLDTYSNHGASVDYCASGSLEVRGQNNNKTTISGTSVSAAIVSTVIAGIKAENVNISAIELQTKLERLVQDIGEPGKDAFFGMGMLTLDSIEGKEEEKTEVKLPELLTCDWKNLSDADLNAIIRVTDEIYQKRFLDDLTESEKAELLGRADILYNHEHTAVVYDAELKEEARFNGKLKDYLYSKFFDDYMVQKETSHEYDKYNGNQPYWVASFTGYVAVNTSLDSTEVPITYKQQVLKGGNTADIYKVTISATADGAFNFKDMEIAGRFLSGDNNAHNLGNTPVPTAVFVKGVKVKKPEHSKITGQEPSVKADGKTMLVVGGFYKAASDKTDTKKGIAYDKNTGLFTITDNNYANILNTTKADYGSNTCKDTNSEDMYIMMSIYEVSENKKKISQIFTLNIKQQESVWDNGSAWTVKQKPACWQKGTEVRTFSKRCVKCDGVVDTKEDSRDIPQLKHNFDSNVWKYARNNGIENGMKYQECTYNCGGTGGNGWDAAGDWWQRNIQYRQIVYYREQDANGNIPDIFPVVKYDNYTKQGEGFSWEMAPTVDYRSVRVDNQNIQSANVYYVTRYRNNYTVTYESSIAGAENIPAAETIVAGSAYKITAKVPTLTGYKFLYWTTNKDGTGMKYDSGTSISVNSNITLYARWEKGIYKIDLDNQGADVNSGGENVVYQMYDTGYFDDKNANKKFTDNKIDIPAKHIEDTKLPDKVRKQCFLGYYTKKNGQGHKMIDADGSLIANINNVGDYKYFTSDSTVYADWEDMFAIQFCDNLTPEDVTIISTDMNGSIIPNVILNPDVQWKESGKDITVSYETVIINNETFKDIYRLKGWSLTPEISGDDEIILSEEKNTYTFSEDEDVTLYAQWDTGFMVAYVGNEQSEGIDYLDEVKKVTDSYTFNPNDRKQIALLPNPTADYFVKTVKRPTIDIATGEAVDERGNPYMEEVPYSFLGWSMYSSYAKQIISELYRTKNGEQDTSKIILGAKEVSLDEPGKGLTFNAPVADYGSYNALHSATEPVAGVDESVKGYQNGIGGIPYVNMYAVWDEYPQIAASDMYFPLSDAQSGVITEEFLLNCAKATDRELKSVTNPDGKVKNGNDVVNKTKFCVLDYQSSEFFAAEGDMAMTITYLAEDAVGNVTTKMVTVHLVDTNGTVYDAGSVRFISADYMDTLAEDSVWRTGEYATKLAEVLANAKVGEEYTTVTPVQQAFGVKSVKKPGSGTWNHVEQVWKFTHREVQEAQTYVKTNGMNGTPNGFLSTFGHCRVQ